MEGKEAMVELTIFWEPTYFVLRSLSLSSEDLLSSVFWSWNKELVA
jgi:hypothetical protein